MPTKIVRDPAHIETLARLLLASGLPLTVHWTKGAPRSEAQNRLSQRWFNDIAHQLGDRDREEVRAQCKLDHGVPILCAESDKFMVSYDRTFGGLTYQQRLEAIQAFNLPVTRLMTTPQMRAFMDAVHRTYSPQGVRLTDPEAMKYENEFA